MKFTLRIVIYAVGVGSIFLVNRSQLYVQFIKMPQIKAEEKRQLRQF